VNDIGHALLGLGFCSSCFKRVWRVSSHLGGNWWMVMGCIGLRWAVSGSFGWFWEWWETVGSDRWCGGHGLGFASFWA
jgi:hypothetical protein